MRSYDLELKLTDNDNYFVNEKLTITLEWKIEDVLEVLEIHSESKTDEKDELIEN